MIFPAGHSRRKNLTIGIGPNILKTEYHKVMHRLHGEFHLIINNQCGSAKLIRRINEFHKNLRQITRFEEPPTPERKSSNDK
jgi:hypothetical protein